MLQSTSQYFSNDFHHMEKTLWCYYIRRSWFGCRNVNHLLQRVEQLEKQISQTPSSTAASVTVVTTAVTTVANTPTTTSPTTSTAAPAPNTQQQQALYLDSYRSWCRQACRVAGLPARPIPGWDVFVQPTCSYMCYNPECRSMSSPINVTYA